VIEVYRKLFKLLDARERNRALLLMGLLMGAALAELAGLSAMLALLNVLAEPARIPDLPWLGTFHAWLAPIDLFVFQVGLAVAVMVVIAAGLAIRALTAYAVIRYSQMRGFTIASRLLAAYLHQPYSWFLGRNSAEIGKSVLSEAKELVSRVMVPALNIVANLLVVALVLGFLLVVDPLIAPLAAGLIGGGYVLIYLRLRPVLQHLGRVRLQANAERFRLAQEATAGFKEVKLMGLADSYAHRFDAPARRMAHAAARSQAMSQLPRFALEGLTFGVLLGVVLALLFRSDGDLGAIVPTLAIFAIATLRLLPALQKIYHSLAELRGGRAVLDHIHGEYTAAMAHRAQQPPAGDPAARLPLTRELVLEEVHFAYPAAAHTALQNVSMTIPARATIGIVGGTGAGKTTLVDLILGLLTPDSGLLRVDGTVLGGDTLRPWQRTVGYVPQVIYLTDDTIAANIAFGVPPEQIDMEGVERAARIAALHDFVIEDLPQGYATHVGERGVRLSGGQRQRIGIARALYREPTLLVMDEATSALDNLTERAVMEAVANMRGDRTIILIAHRLSTVKDCDTIFLMERGRLVAFGTYDELVSGNESFRKMAGGVG
jgi:ATP-binding cassette, subfamily B, bacterial PglK